MSRDNAKPLANERNLKSQLKSKSRRRREDLARLASSTAIQRVLRNDILPLLEITYVPLDDLQSSARKLRTLEAAHVREVASSIAALGFCAPVLIGKDNVILDGQVRVAAARLLGLDRVPCVKTSHLSETEQRLISLAVNRLGEKGQWDLDELKIEFEELILEDAPIEISGFTLDEIDQIVIGDEAEMIEQGQLEPPENAVAVARVGDIFQLGPHRIICGDSTNPAVIRRLREGDDKAVRLVLTDVPYNVKIAGNVTGGAHREFAMASGEMSDDQFLAFNVSWTEAVLPHLCEGGVFSTFIDWRGWPIIHAAAVRCSLAPLNLVVWAKANAGMGAFYRSKHELLPLYKKGDAPHVNNIRLGKNGRNRSNVWDYPGASSLGSDAAA